MTTMMIETQIIDLTVMTDIIRIYMTDLNTIIIGLDGQVAILHSMIIDATIIVIIILHLINSRKVKDKIKVKARFTTIPEVTIQIPTINMIIEARTEVIHSTITTIKEKITRSEIISQTMGIGIISNQKPSKGTFFV